MKIPFTGVYHIPEMRPALGDTFKKLREDALPLRFKEWQRRRRNLLARRRYAAKAESEAGR